MNTITFPGMKEPKNTMENKAPLVNFKYLESFTRGRSEGMAVLINAYLEETPSLLEKMKKGIESNDLEAAGAAIHTLIPSFPVLGLDPSFEKTARKIQDICMQKENTDSLKELYGKIEDVCEKVMDELKQKLVSLHAQRSVS